MQSLAHGVDARTAFDRFITNHPEYERTSRIDTLRQRDFARLDRQGQTYVDYTGSGLYASSQITRHAEALLGHILGNPHSDSPASRESTSLVEHCRRRVLEFFRADPQEYAVVFTANASHALKLVGESYPFGPRDTFLLTFDNHNSVNGIREFDRLRGARTSYVPMLPPELRVNESVLDLHLGQANGGGNNLFAYPAQSNFSGVQHPLEWIERAQSRGFDVLLDAAAFVPTNRLDLSRFGRDFVALSFYKMFGYPTGVGALIARHSALQKLHRPWFAGGTIEAASVQADRFVFSIGAAGFEDGTLDFASIPAVELGLDVLESVGLDLIHERVRLLTGWVIEQLLAIAHPNGRPLVRLYGPGHTDRRGGTLAFNFYDADERIIDHREVERRAGLSRISLRSGCFCNPGAGELALGLSRGELEKCFAAHSRMTREDLRLCIDPKATGAVRVSFGLASNFADAHAFVEFAATFAEPK
ncbi:MAG: aminotransferase class V-fold PLP-dependent enzyme [Vicinamibacteria bacterium]